MTCSEALIWSLTPHRSHHTPPPTWEVLCGGRSNTNTISSQDSLSVCRREVFCELAFGDGSGVYIPPSVTGETGLGSETTAQTCIVRYLVVLLPV